MASWLETNPLWCHRGPLCFTDICPSLVAKVWASCPLHHLRPHCSQIHTGFHWKSVTLPGGCERCVNMLLTAFVVSFFHGGNDPTSSCCWTRGWPVKITLKEHNLCAFIHHFQSRTEPRPALRWWCGGDPDSCAAADGRRDHSPGSWAQPTRPVTGAPPPATGYSFLTAQVSMKSRQTGTEGTSEETEKHLYPSPSLPTPPPPLPFPLH